MVDARSRPGPRGRVRTERLILRNLPFARAIRELRYGVGMLQEEFAADLGCSIAALSAWENGQTQPGRLAERALHDVADEHGWIVNLQAGSAAQRQRRGVAVAD